MKKMSLSTLTVALALSFAAAGAVQAQTAAPAAQPVVSHHAMVMPDHNVPDHPVTEHKVLTAAPVLDDAQIAHIAYTAGSIDVTAAKQALAKSQNKEVRAFAELMARDHTAVNNQAAMLLKRLKVTPKENATSRTLLQNARAERQRLNGLTGEAFDKAYVDNEVAFHKTVVSALNDTLIPEAKNSDLKSLLSAGSSLFESHEKHAEMLAATLK